MSNANASAPVPPKGAKPPTSALHVVSPWKKLSKARQTVRTAMPYLDSALMLLAPIDTPGLGTLGVTKNGTLMIDLEWFGTQSDQEAAGLLVHEIMHVLRDTHGRTVRLVGFDPNNIPFSQITDEQRKLLRWSNQAADYAINPDCLAAGFELPKEGCFPANEGWAEGLLHEEYFRMIEDRETNGGKCQGGKCHHNHGAEKPQAGKGWCGSGGGMPIDGEPNEGKAGPGEEQLGRTPAEMDQMRRTVATAVKEAAGRGAVPAGLDRWAGEMIKPSKVPWRQLLRRAVRYGIASAAGAVDLRYDGPSRRQAAMGYGPGSPVMPRFRAPEPDVTIFFDTSGSMHQARLEMGMAEVDGVLKSIRGSANFLSIDAAISKPLKVKSWRDVKLLGGGGTYFDPAFAYLAGLRKKPSVVIFVTDGDAGGIPAEQPEGSRFIWLLTGKECTCPVSWGTQIHVDDSD